MKKRTRSKGPSVRTADGRTVHLKRSVKLGPGFAQQVEAAANAAVRVLTPALKDIVGEAAERYIDRYEKQTDARLQRLEGIEGPGGIRVHSTASRAPANPPDEYEIVERSEGMNDLVKLAWTVVEQADMLDSHVHRIRASLEGPMEPAELTPHSTPGSGQLRALNNALRRTQAFIGRATDAAEVVDRLTRDTGQQGASNDTAKVSR